MRCFGDPKDTIDSKQLKNQIYLLRFGHTRALLLKKKDTKWPFPPSSGNWPICTIDLMDCMPTSLPDQSADKTMPPPTASPAEKGSRPPTWILLVRAGLSDQPFLTLLVRSRHVKSNKEQLAMLHILTSPTLLRNLPNPHIGKYSAKGSTRNFKTVQCAVHVCKDLTLPVWCWYTLRNF